jgi:ABC-2 type transport system permease protein
MNFVIMPVFFLSGALFPLDPASTPRALLWIAAFNPLAYGIDGLRAVLTMQPVHFGLPLDAWILSLAAAAMLALGARLFSRIQL